MIGTLRLYLALLVRSKIATLGAVLTTSGFAAEAIMLGMSLALPTSNPYLGIFAFFVFPGLAAAGLVLIPVGLWRAAREAGQGRITLAGLRRVAEVADPIALRRIFVLVLLLSSVNLVIFGVAGYRGYHYMDSTEFCGQVCHQVMEPELMTYRRSPHSEVPCVDCHIGQGADWFVKAKLSGTRQVLAVLADSFPRPIPTPVENLRPARDTCERCHRPQMFHGNLMRVIERFDEDENNTLRYTVLNLRVGGGRELGRPAEGIHWHVDRSMKLSYVATDRKRQHVVRVEVEDAAGKKTVWRRQGEASDGGIVRSMDCVDCHNRPTHIYLQPAIALDERLSVGAIDRTIPWIKKEALAVLAVDYPDTKSAVRGIGSLADRYRQSYPEIWNERREQIERAVEALIETWKTFVHPNMNIRWGTYKSELTHRGDTEGCYRCHNDQLVTAEGKPIGNECEMCHYVLAVDQIDPELFRYLKASRTVSLF